MGTDIHMFIEKKCKYGDNKGRWVLASPMTINSYRDDTLPIQDRVEPMEVFDDRDYDLFAMLANVRNGRGFAGIVTGEGFKSISSPKGLPQDISNDLGRYAEDYYEHSGSYLTLKELLEYTELSKKMYTHKQGVVNDKGYKTFKEKGMPECWCGRVGGGNTKIISNEEMENVEYLEDNHTYYTEIQWKVNYYDWAWKRFEERVINKWIKEDINCYNEFNEDEIRIVFWFDS